MKKRNSRLLSTFRQLRASRILMTGNLSRALLLSALGLATGLVIVLSQGDARQVAVSQGLQQQEDQVIRKFDLPPAPAPEPAAPAPEPAAPESAPEPVAPEPAPEPAPNNAAPESNQPNQPNQPNVQPSPQPSPSSTPNSSTPKPSEGSKDPLRQSGVEIATGPQSQYLLEFNRSPAIGNRFRLEGINAESRLGFPRPRSWAINGAKAIIRFQHSPNLIASKSNLIVRVNDTSIGSVPLNLKDAQIGEAVINIPPGLLQDFNEITLVAQQSNSQTCTNPDDKALWTEVLPDSKILLDYRSKNLTLDFARFPYPFFDNLALDSNRINYLTPSQASGEWLTAASRFQTYLGRVHDFRPLETRLVKDLKSNQWNDRTIVIGTPDDQPALKGLKLPLALNNGKFLDGNKSALPGDVGILMMTTATAGGPPILIISGNSPEGVAKATQFLVQTESAKIGTGQFVLVNNEKSLEANSPGKREWQRFIPGENKFELSKLLGNDNKPFQDVTVRGVSAPRVEFPFRALPDDQFIRGNTMTLKYSHSANIDVRKSTVSVFIDNIGVGSKKLTNENGATNESFSLDLPANLIKPNSRIGVDFKLVPRNPETCGPTTDQQLWGTVQKDTNFNLNREIAVQLPDLKLATVGYPFAGPQDLSRTAIVLPDKPTDMDIMTLMKFSERMGRLTPMDRQTSTNTVKHSVYLASGLPQDVKDSKHLVAVGTRDRFPLQEVFKEKSGFQLLDFFARGFKQAQIQSLPDNGGVIKSILSPWWKAKSGDNDQRVILALTAQTEAGMQQVQDVLSNDSWFSQLQNDTVLISANKNVSPYDSNAYQFQFLEQSDRTSSENLNLLSKMRRFFQNNWWLLPTGIIALSVLLYGIAQLYLKRVSGESNS
jgi:cellulose synthase operon protein B